MRSFLISLEKRGVRYLLINGQASVLHGAAKFSEDVDLWIDPEKSNLTALQSALRAAGARVHKLTPPLTLRNLRRGHGFYFLLPEDDIGPAYLDSRITTSFRTSSWCA